MRRRWPLALEILWWIETVAVCALIPTLAIATGVLFAPIFVPILLSHLRNGRSLGPNGYWFSVLVVSLQAGLVAWIPLSGQMERPFHWLLWIVGFVTILLIAVPAWFVRPLHDGSGDAAQDAEPV